jgi:hypothetical protein
MSPALQVCAMRRLADMVKRLLQAAGEGFLDVLRN